MRKYAMAALMLIAVLLIGVNSFAGAVVFKGTVKDGAGKVLSGAKVTINMQHEYLSAYTNSLGQYTITKGMHNFCDFGRVAWAEKIGYYTGYKTVYDGSCCSCNPDCPPAYGEIACVKTITQNFTLLKRPGTAAMGDSAPLAIRPELLENEGALLRFGLFYYWVTYCNRNKCGPYECLAQVVEDFINGPEYAFGHPTRPDIELTPCPDTLTFVDFVNNWLDAMWEYFYGDNFPDEEPALAE